MRQLSVLRGRTTSGRSARLPGLDQDSRVPRGLPHSHHETHRVGHRAHSRAALLNAREREQRQPERRERM